jgi:hypothetical protein
MVEPSAALRLQVTRQARHWQAAAAELADLTMVAAPAAWQALEQYVDLALRSRLQEAVSRVQAEATEVVAELQRAHTSAELEAVSRQVLALRRHYLQVETLLDYFGNVVNHRTSPRVGAFLRGLDTLAADALATVLGPLGLEQPPVLTYLDKGLGASIAKAGLRLTGDRMLSPVATIKVTRHMRSRPTSVLHEAGHQIAHQTGWNEHAAKVLRAVAAPAGAEVAETWKCWASETVADLIAFSLAGYGAVATLHDVLAGEPELVFQTPPGDPHPPAALRVLFNTALCSCWYGEGPWDDLARSWMATHPLAGAPASFQAFARASLPLLPAFAEALTREPVPGFRNQPLCALADPRRASPAALTELTRQAGPALYTSPYLMRRESLRTLALSSYRAATEPDHATEIARETGDWIQRLGGAPTGAVPAQRVA